MVLNLVGSLLITILFTASFIIGNLKMKDKDDMTNFIYSFNNLMSTRSVQFILLGFNILIVLVAQGVICMTAR